jgi:hypothetical protein
MGDRDGPLLQYVSSLTRGKIILWCYLIWYLVTVAHHFDPSPRLWLNSMGISAVVGFALHLSVEKARTPKVDHWQTFRLFLMPFCVSSFSALTKGQGFLLVLPPSPTELLLSLVALVLFLLAVGTTKRLQQQQTPRG